MKKFLFNVSLMIFLYLGNLFIINYNYYFALIYSCIVIYHIFIFYFLHQERILNKNEEQYFLIISILLYLITYFIICDPNPFTLFFFYYTFNPCFIKGILIIFIHMLFLDKYKDFYKNHSINLKANNNIYFNLLLYSFFLSDYIQIIIKRKSSLIIFLFSLILFFCCDALLFVNRIKIWVNFYGKNKTLPNSFSKNTTYYIASNIVNIEYIIEHYIKEMKKLINYLGESKVIISIVENGDSKDNTRKYLENFQDYLNKKNIINRFSLTKEIYDPRLKIKPFLKTPPSRIEYYSKLRNKCLDLLYELNNIDFENTIIIFFNDVLFQYEDIINLLSTNNENFDAVCGFDMINNYFYDHWVTIDLDGNRLNSHFPFFSNKEAQDLVIYHKPIRVFSCWNGVIAFKASPLNDRKVKFRYKVNNSLPKHRLNNQNKHYFESECTYFHIDLFSLGYSKKFINPDVRVSYYFYKYFEAIHLIPSIKHIYNYFLMYFINFPRKRNKYMSNYINKNIKLNPILKLWYLENKIDSY